MIFRHEESFLGGTPDCCRLMSLFFLLPPAWYGELQVINDFKNLKLKCVKHNLQAPLVVTTGWATSCHINILFYHLLQNSSV